jgi:hypothetical protein
MSDELPIGSMTLEGDDGGEIVGAPITTPVEAAEPEPEGTVEMPTGKVVPLAALQSEREGRKAAAAEANALKERLTAAEAKAAQLDQIAGEWAQVQPLINSVRNGTYQPPAPPKVEQTLSEAEAIDYAKDLDLYKPDGKPDVDRAQRLAARQERLSQQAAARAIAPLHATEAQRASDDMRQRIAGLKDATGFQVPAEFIDQVWKVVPAELSAQPNVAGVLHRVALAEAILAGKHPAMKAGAPPPVVPTASLGGGRQGEAPVDSRFATAAGISQKVFKETAAAYKPGHSNVLE